MEEEIKELRKVCPVCEGKYSGRDNYCSSDGSKLIPGIALIANRQTVRDTDPDLHAPLNQPEQG
jgi:hypothetical protein